MTRIRVQKDIEKSAVVGSILVTNDSNECKYLAPSINEGARLAIVNGKPVYTNTQLAWAKEGTDQNTDAEDVLVTDNIFQNAKVNVGGDETDIPFKEEYQHQINGNARVYGIDVRNQGFLMDRSRILSFQTVTVGLDVVNGIDDLEPTAYGLGGNLITNTKFLTFRKLFDWVARCEAPVIMITLEGTTALSRLVMNGSIQMVNKTEVSFVGVGQQYIDLQAGLTSFGSNFRFVNLDFLVNINDAFYCTTNGTMQFDGTTVLTFGVGTTQMISITQSASGMTFNGSIEINFTANNQKLFHASGNGGGTVVFGNHTTGFTINSGIYTGLRWAVNTPTRSFSTWFCAFSVMVIPSNIDMSDTVVHYGSSMALLQKEYDILSYDYALNLGTAKPLRFLEVNSGTANLTGTLASLVINELGEAGKGELASVGIEGDETFSATAVQTNFIISATPKGKILGFINGSKRHNLAFTYIGTNVTYDKTYNDNYDLELNDIINFIY